MRITLTWDTYNTDFDLWVTDPNGEQVTHAHKTSDIGGELGDDNIYGYGPEYFTLEQGEAISGNYLITARYCWGNLPSNAYVVVLLHEGQWNENILTLAAPGL